jgi:hypothetical protein
MDRRVALIRLEPDCEHPEKRSDFAHADLESWVRANQPELLGAALTILVAYASAGRPHVPVEQWGSYEAWSAAVRAPLVWCGGRDPALTREGLAASSPVDDAAGRFVHAWRALTLIHGAITAGRALRLIYPQAPDLTALDFENAMDPWPELREAVEELAALPAGRRVSSAQLGKILAANRGRVFRGVVIQSRLLDGTTRWFTTGSPAGMAKPPSEPNGAGAARAPSGMNGAGVAESLAVAHAMEERGLS